MSICWVAVLTPPVRTQHFIHCIRTSTLIILTYVRSPFTTHIHRLDVCNTPTDIQGSAYLVFLVSCLLAADGMRARFSYFCIHPCHAGAGWARWGRGRGGGGPTYRYQSVDLWRDLLRPFSLTRSPCVLATSLPLDSMHPSAACASCLQKPWQGAGTKETDFQHVGRYG